MERIAISIGASGYSSLLIAHFSLKYNLDPMKVQGELRKLNCAGAKGISVERVENACFYVYRVTFPNQCIDGIALTVEMIGGKLEELEGEVREAMRVKECLQMIEKGE